LELLALLVAGAALFISWRRLSRLHDVEARLAAIEGRLERLGPPLERPDTSQPFAAPAPDIGESRPADAPAEAASGAAPAPGAEPTPAEPAATSVPPASPPPPAPPPRGFEERFGTQWVVWVGGLALALGGIFLVRYSIEQGWIGPGVRIMLGGLLATALVAAGEWTRRNEIRTGFADIPTAHIPGILTAAGTTVAYATVYAAYGLYGFLAPGAAFVMLGVVALATLAAALLHGPALAGLGLVGAYVAPFLVSTERPNFWALYLYLAVVTAASFGLARLRLWRWLAITAMVFSAC